MGRKYDIMRDAALRETGAKWRKSIMFWEGTKTFGPWLLGAVILGSLGWGAHRLWLAVVKHVPHPGAVPVPTNAAHAVGSLPGWLWLAVGALALMVFWLFRPGRLMTPSARRMRLVQTAAAVVVFAGLFSVGLAVGSA